MQLSNLEVIYDTSKPERRRLVSALYDGEEIDDDDVFEVCMSGIISRGGDHYDVFKETVILREYKPLGDMTIEYFRKHGTVPTPVAGRQRDLAAGN
jgi:hypothetical protein